MRIVHAADIHLDLPLKGMRKLPGTAHEEVRLATRNAFVRLIDLCLEEQAALLLIAGDLFDQEQRDFQAGLFAARQFSRLHATKTAVVLVRGNHDAANLTKTLRETKNVPVSVLNHLKPESVDFPDLEVIVHGQSFADAHVRENLARKLPHRRDDRFNIGLLHADVNGSADGAYAYAPCTLSDLIDKGYDYWALGHSHVRAELHQNPYIVYPGNLQGRHIQETGTKGCTVLEIEDNQIVQVIPRSCDIVRWEHVRVDVTGCATPDSVFESASQALQARRRACVPYDHPLVARVILHGSARAHSALIQDAQGTRDQIAAIAADWSIWPEKIEIATTMPQATETALPSGFLAELCREFERLGNDTEALQSYLSPLADLDQLASVHRLDPNPVSVERAQDLLRASADLVLARLGCAGAPKPQND